MTDDALELNRRWWDEAAVDHHERTYDLDVLRAGGETLYPIEAAELPADLTGQRLCHLQCHIGPDTLSLARRGATVVGVDFSPEAVRRARLLAEETGLAGSVEFVEATVEDARAAVAGEFDGIFTTWGTVVWLPSVTAWAAVAASLLRPGGWLYLADSHPYAISVVFDDVPYGGATATRIDEPGDYMDRAAVRAHTATVEFSHGVGEIVSALTGAGFHLDWLHEHDGVPWAMGPDVVLHDDRLYRRPDSTLPLSFSLRASRPADHAVGRTVSAARLS